MHKCGADITSTDYNTEKLKLLNNAAGYVKNWKRKDWHHKLGRGYYSRAIFELRWNWEKYVKPIAKTSNCQAPHMTYVISKNESCCNGWCTIGGSYVGKKYW